MKITKDALQKTSHVVALITDVQKLDIGPSGERVDGMYHIMFEYELGHMWIGVSDYWTLTETNRYVPKIADVVLNFDGITSIVTNIQNDIVSFVANAQFKETKEQYEEQKNDMVPNIVPINNDFVPQELIEWVFMSKEGLKSKLEMPPELEGAFQETKALLQGLVSIKFD